MSKHADREASGMPKQSADQQLEQLLAAGKQDERIASALEHYHRAAALVPAVTYSKPTTRYSAGANQ